MPVPQPYRIEVCGVADCEAARSWLASLGDRFGRGEGTVLTSGRNENRRMRLPTGNGHPVDVVVKRFGNPGWLDRYRIRWRRTKARRSWLAARHLLAAGVGTPRPLALVERWQQARLTESYLVTAYVPDAGSFADELVQLYRREPDGTKLMALLQTVAAAIRAMHDAGFVHMDLGNQNILLKRAGTHQWTDVQFIDLNRGHIRPEVSVPERGRDLSRIALPSDFLRVFKEMYLGQTPPRDLHDWEQRYRLRYRWHARTRRWRHPIREARRRPVAGDPPTYPGRRAIWIWDPLSRQPLITMVRRERKHFYSWRRHLQVVVATLRALPGTLRSYRRYLAGAYTYRVAMQGRVGLAVEWTGPEAASRALEKLAALGPIPLLVRFYRHADPEEWAATAAFAQQLHARGHRIGVALLQDRSAVQHPALWQAFVDEVLGRVRPFVAWVEVAHAINRVKWGIWTFREYHRLMAPLVRWRAQWPEVQFTGPAVIDFEYAYIAAALDHLPAGMRFDALSHHLYVDRRGAPERPQGRFALLEKLALARAMATAHPACGAELIVSEFNWPLRGTGIHSPVGAPYVSPGIRRGDPSVTEEQSADYMVRYLLISLCSGLAGQVYWWTLTAHGFGLIDDADGAWRERPGYHALQTFLQRLSGWVFTGREAVQAPQGGSLLIWHFEQQGTEQKQKVIYAYPEDAVWQPEAGDQLYDTYGEPVAPVQGDIMVTGSPMYVVPHKTAPV